MSKRKDAVALFDLINKGKPQQASPGLNVPGWFSNRPPAAPEAGAEAAAPGESPTAPPPPPAPAYSPFSTAAAGEPVFQAEGGRVRISLNYVACGATALGLIVALGFMFYIGRISVRPSRPPATPPDGGLINQVPYRPPIGGADANPGAVLSAAREKGKFYLIVDRMPGSSENDKKDAEAIVEYLRTKSKPAVVVQWKDSGAYSVLSMTGFDSSSSPEAADYVKAIEDLGKNYRPPPPRGRYTFSQHSAGRLTPSWRREP